MFVGGTSFRTGGGPGFVTQALPSGTPPAHPPRGRVRNDRRGPATVPEARRARAAVGVRASARPVPAPGHPAGAADGYAIAGTALGLRGSPYRNGGSDPSGFDCSGFVRYVFAQHGIGLGRTVGEQFHEGTEVKAGVEAGDLIFFAASNSRAVSHVGMAIGGDEFVHAPSSRGEVRVERLTAPYWASRYIGARRIR